MKTNHTNFSGRLIGAAGRHAIAFTAMVLVAGMSARASDLALDARVGTTGLGLEAVTALGSKVNLRLGYNQGSLNFDTSQNDIDYDAELSLQSASALLDWHPAGGVFRFSAGVYYNGNEGDATATPTSSKRIGDYIFTAAQIGTLTANVTFPELAGYFGIGFGNAVSQDGHWSALCDIGVLFHGAPDFTLTADGSLSGNSLFQQELEKERQDIDDDYVSKVRYYPVLTIGIAYRF